PEQSGRMFQSGSFLYVVSQGWDRPTGEAHQRVYAIDVSNLGAPRVRGSVEIPIDQGGWWFSWGWGGNDSGIVMVEGDRPAILGGPSVQDSFGQWRSPQPWSGVDLRNPDAPSWAGQVDLGAQWAWGLIPAGPRVYMTHAEAVGGQPPV